jgi:hypothetical protein
MTIRRMRFSCCIIKSTDTYSEYVVLIFHGNNTNANAVQNYVTPKLALLSNSGYVFCLPVCNDVTKQYSFKCILLNASLT